MSTLVVSQSLIEGENSVEPPVLAPTLEITNDDGEPVWVTHTGGPALTGYLQGSSYNDKYTASVKAGTAFAIDHLNVVDLQGDVIVEAINNSGEYRESAVEGSDFLFGDGLIAFKAEITGGYYPVGIGGSKLVYGSGDSFTEVVLSGGIYGQDGVRSSTLSLGDGRDVLNVSLSWEGSTWPMVGMNNNQSDFGAGDDSLTISLLNSKPQLGSWGMTAGFTQLGAGNDRLTVTAVQGMHAARVDAGDGDDTLTINSVMLGMQDSNIKMGAGNDRVVLSESAVEALTLKNSTVELGAGDDWIELKRGTATISGGEGNDTLYIKGKSADYTWVASGTDFVVTTATDSFTALRLSGVEKVQFADTVVNLADFSPVVPTLQFASMSGSVNEGNTGSTTVTVQASLSAASSQAVTVPITYSGTATSGTDYSNASTSLTIAAGQTTGSATFSVIGDTTVELDETVVLTMGTPTNATLGANPIYTHTITNDDPNVGPKVLGGVAYHWKSHALLPGVTLTGLDPKAVQTDSSDRFDLRAASLNAATNTLSVELWMNNPNQTVSNFDFTAQNSAAVTASFIPALDSAEWTVNINASNPNRVVVAGYMKNDLESVSGSVKLGTMQYTLSAGATSPVSFTNLKLGKVGLADVQFGLTTATTAANGQFVMAAPASDDQVLSAHRATSDGSIKGGVTAADALAALMIAVELNPNPDPDGTGPNQALKVSPYQVIAADVNQDGEVSSIDAFTILKMAVGRADAPPASWLFVPEQRDFWDDTNQQFTLNRLNANWDPKIVVSATQTQSNLVGLTRGDVNGSWSLAGASTVEASNPTHFQTIATLIGAPLDQWGIASGG